MTCLSNHDAHNKYLNTHMVPISIPSVCHACMQQSPFCRHVHPMGLAAIWAQITLVASSSQPAGSPMSADSSGSGLMSEVPVTKLMSKISPRKRTGNITVDYERGMERQAFIDCISWLEKYPEHGIATLSFIKTRVKEGLKLQGTDSTTSFNEVTTLAKIDETWMVSFLCSQSGLKEVTLAKCKQQDPDVIKHLFCFALHASPMCKVPPECVNKQVMNLACASRAHEVGERLKGLDEKMREQKVISEDGVINWGQLGSYSLEFDTSKDRATKVLHRPTSVTAGVLDSMHISGDFELQSNWSDVAAVCIKGPAKFKMQDFFDKGTGPHLLKPMVGKSEVFATHARAAHSKHSRKASDLMADQLQENPEAYQGPLKEKAREATKRAREALAQRQIENRSRRKILVSAAI